VLKSDTSGLTEVVASGPKSGDLNPITLTLPDSFESGSYLVEVSTSGGGMPFRYVLALADLTKIAGVNARYSEPSFVMDQAVVQMEPLAGARSLISSMAVTMGVTATKHLGRDLWLMERSGSGLKMLSEQADQGAKKATLNWIRSLGQQPGVDLAEPNYVYTAQVSPGDDDFYNRQWALPYIQTPLAWQTAPNVGAGVGIAILDTGVFRSPPTSTGNWHPDLSANIRLIPGEIMDYVSGSLDIDQEDDGKRDTNPADPGDGKSQSSNFHGTHVAGIAGAVDNDIGIVGVAPGTLLYPVRVLGEGGVGSSADLIAAIEWAASRSEIDVLNLSLGGLGSSEALKNSIDLAWNAGDGQLIVAAAGNAATDEATYPAAYDNVVGVGAVDGDGVLATYSNIGPSVDLVAPGGDASRDANQDGAPDVIVSTWGTDEENNFVPGYTALQGTSMAAPHVAGVYALMKGEIAGLTPGQFMAFLKAGDLTRPVGPAFEYGAGLIDALKSMDAALGGAFPVTLSSSPTALQLNAAVLEAELVLTAFPEGETFQVTNVTSSAEWLSASLDPEKTDPASATIAVSADTSALDSQQRYATELLIDYSPDNGDAATLSVPVSLQLDSTPEEKDAGRHYVLLINSSEDASDGEVVAQAVVTAVNGQYDFVFDNVELGEYFLVAGTDTDNNGFICENGEACAEYPVNGLPETISLGEIPRSGVVLNTSFRRPTISALGGLPRVGFEGYRVKAEVEDDTGDPVKEYAR
jgi:serine protease